MVNKSNVKNATYRVLNGVLVFISCFGLSVGCNDNDAGKEDSGSHTDSGDDQTDSGCREIPIYLDNDGDERGADIQSNADAKSHTLYCPGDEPPAGYVFGGGDCDDSDPFSYQKYARDLDKDGHGNLDESLDICAGHEPPNGYAIYHDDCDDTDEAINPAAIDFWYDGQDSNCDGLDIPEDCPLGDKGIYDMLAECHSCEAKLADQMIEIDSSCVDLSDLFIADLFNCNWDCNATFHLRIGNRGTSPAQGDVLLSIIVTSPFAEDDSINYSIPVDLEPGELSVPFMLPDYKGPFDVSIESKNIEECDSSNNHTRIVGYGFDCGV